MVDEQNKKEQPNLITKQCVVGPKSLLGVKNCSFHFWPVNSFHVRSADFSALSAGRRIGLRCSLEGGVKLKSDKGLWGIVCE